jgi:uncharacterized protein (DUF4415 family)
MVLKVGYRWAKIEVIALGEREYHQESWIDQESGTIKHGGVHTWIDTATLRCNCGATFTLDVEEVDKQLHKACEKCTEELNRQIDNGEVPAPTGMPGRPRHYNQPKVTFSVALPLDILTWAREESYKRRSSVSAIVTEAMLMLMKSRGVESTASVPEWAE